MDDSWRRKKSSATLDVYLESWKRYAELVNEPAMTFREYVSKLSTNQKKEVLQLLKDRDSGDTII